MTGYLPIPTYGRIKDPAIKDATGKTVRAATTRMVQTGGRGMAMPGTSAGTSSGGMMPSAPSMDSTGSSNSGALEYDTTGIGYDHYHDALVNQSGGMGPDGRYQSGFLAGKTQEEARKFSADQWQAHNKAGTAQKMIQNLARVYGTPKQTQAAPAATPRLPMPATQSQPMAGQSPASQIMAKLGMPAPSSPTAPGTGVLKPSASAGVLPSPRRSNDDALARRLKAQSGNPTATVMENGKAVTTANGTVQPMALAATTATATAQPDPLMKQAKALQSAATGLDNAKTLMANRPAAKPMPAAASPVKSPGQPGKPVAALPKPTQPTKDIYEIAADYRKMYPPTPPSSFMRDATYGPMIDAVKAITTGVTSEKPLKDWATQKINAVPNAVATMDQNIEAATGLPINLAGAVKSLGPNYTATKNPGAPVAPKSTTKPVSSTPDYYAMAANPAKASPVTYTPAQPVKPSLAMGSKLPMPRKKAM